MILLTFLTGLGAAEDRWGIAVAAAKPGPGYQKLVDAEVAWFTAKVIDPHLATLPTSEKNQELRRKILEMAAVSHLAGSIRLPLPLSQAYFLAKPLLPAKSVPGTDPLLAWTTWRLAQSSFLTQKARTRNNDYCRIAWQAQPARWQAQYPTCLMIEVDNACLETWNDGEAKSIDQGKQIARRLAGWYETA